MVRHHAVADALLIELDERTGYLDCFAHAGDKQARRPVETESDRGPLAYSTNLGLTNMAEASGISYDILTWAAEWYVLRRSAAVGVVTEVRAR
ncbi:transposase [Nocardia spumae]|uniref:transposase n=1 Tax=Nocardia spumae TaxID=2887190 RepID=UPI001D153647|nr:transposase [Nocardia spumae]